MTKLGSIESCHRELRFLAVIFPVLNQIRANIQVQSLEGSTGIPSISFIFLYSYYLQYCKFLLLLFVEIDCDVTDVENKHARDILVILVVLKKLIKFALLIA